MAFVGQRADVFLSHSRHVDRDAQIRLVALMKSRDTALLFAGKLPRRPLAIQFLASLLRVEILSLMVEMLRVTRADEVILCTDNS